MKVKYRFDKDLVRFVKVHKSFRERIINFLYYSTGFIIAAIILNIIFNYFFESPKEKRFMSEQEELVIKFEMLNKDLDEMDYILSTIQQRDDQVYRPIFDEKPIPKSIREAGFGGVNRYIDLENMKEAELLIKTSKRIDKVLKQIYIQSKSYDKIIELAMNKDKMIASIPAIQPVSIKDLTRTSSYFGNRVDPFTGFKKHHEGMDFTGPVGTDIYVTGDGVVTRAEYSREGYGVVIYVNHGYGYITRYAHLNKILVRNGQQVKRGEIIGLMGNTGRSKGPHLHYEVRLNGIPMNPINFYFNDINAEQYDMMVNLSSEDGGKTLD